MKPKYEDSKKRFKKEWSKKNKVQKCKIGDIEIKKMR